MSVRKVNGVYHFRFEYRGKEIRKSTRQGDKRTAEMMEAAEKTACARGEAGLGDKPKVPTLGRFLRDRIVPWASIQEKETTRLWYMSGVKPLLAYAPLSDRALDEMTSEHVAAYSAHRRTAEFQCGK